MKASELHDMSDEQLGHTLRETTEGLFRLRIQAQTERLDAPSELRHHRRLVARIKTIQRLSVKSNKQNQERQQPAAAAAE